MYWNLTDVAINNPIFIEYGKVTESNCLSWAKSLLGDTKVKQYEDEVASKLTLLKTPITGVGKPWA